MLVIGQLLLIATGRFMAINMAEHNGINESYLFSFQPPSNEYRYFLILCSGMCCKPFKEKIN